MGPLPGANVKSYSGYLTVNKSYNSNLFFWFFPAKVGLYSTFKLRLSIKTLTIGFVSSFGFIEVYLPLHNIMNDKKNCGISVPYISELGWLWFHLCLTDITLKNMYVN